MPRVGPVLEPAASTTSGGRRSDSQPTLPEIVIPKGWGPPGSDQVDDEPRSLSGAELFIAVRNLIRGADAKRIEDIVVRIRTLGGDPAQVALVPLVFEEPGMVPLSLPLFRVTGKDGREHFVDDAGRHYKTFEQWRKTNQLPPGRVTFPEGGRITGVGGIPARRVVTETPRSRLGR